jgi:hypothetical protein
MDARRQTSEPVQVWLVERTFSDDEQNIVILLYATPDGERVLRKERALTSFTGPARETKAAVEAEPQNLDTVEDRETSERYATEAARMREQYDPDDAV